MEGVCRNLLTFWFVFFGSRGLLVFCEEDPYTKVWIIGHGHDFAAHEYVDEGGYISGFTSELIAEVCAAAGIKCRATWLPYSWCWDTTSAKHPVAGIGLISGWMDACAAWKATIDRIHVFDFSLPYIKADEEYFYVKPGVTFDPQQLANKTIMFLHGEAADEKCLARHMSGKGTFLKETQVIYASDTEDFMQKILNGDVDAGFGPVWIIAEYPGQVTSITPGMFDCPISGNGMMTRKDNDFNTYWNMGFQQLRNSGRFRKLCEEANKNHGAHGEILCV